MKIKFCLLIFSFLSLHSFSQTNVVYGEHGYKADCIGIYIDKDGSIYPDYFIADSSLKQSNSSLRVWYKNNPSQFSEVAKKYNCTFSNYSTDNASVLEDSIFSIAGRNILKRSSDKASVTFLIHGFRKPFKEGTRDLSSVRMYEKLKNGINEYRKSNTLFVELYWDGCYDCCFSATHTKKNKQMFAMFEEAQQNAVNVGKGFRVLLSKVDDRNINIVTHSLGAKVALAALFDYEKFDYKTPANKSVKICLIAPAVPGNESFQNYYYRHTSIDFKKNDNYKLMIVYNEKDFVLRKKVGWFGPGPYKHGVTTLGCNHKKEVIKLEEYFKTNFPNSSINKCDLTTVGKCHMATCYCNDPKFKDVVKFLDE